MTELIIEGYRVDLSADFSSLLTFAIDDITDFGSRQTTFSKTIIIPGTANNNKVFGSLFDVTASNPYNPNLPNVNINFNAAKKARCFIFQNQIQSFKGSIRILGVVIDRGSIEYEAAVFGELYGLINNIGSGRLQDLDFSAYDHVFNTTNITASWANYNAGLGYYYPMIDYGGYSTGKANWDIGTFRPALFAKQYLEKIFAEAGYTYDFPLINTERFKRLIVPYNRKVLTATNTILLNRIAFPFVNNSDNFFLLEFATGTLGAFTTSDDQIYTYTGATVLVNVAVEFEYIDYTYKPEEVIFSLLKNGITQFSIPATTLGTYNLNGTISISTGDTIAVEISSIIILNNGDFLSISGTILVTSDIALPTNVLTGDTVRMNDTIPATVLQKDFLSSIVKLFNLYIYEDFNIEKHINILPYVEFYSTTELNWTGKLDRSQPIQIAPMAVLNSRFYDFKYKEDSDYHNDLYQKRYGETYGQYTLDTAFDFEDDRTVVELIFSPTPLVGYQGEDKIYSSILKIENSNETQTDSNIRLLLAYNVTGVTAWNITPGVNGLTTYGYAGHLNDPDVPSNDINFGAPRELFFTLTNGNLSNNQFNIYHSSYMAEITDKDSRLMRCKMRLTVADIVSLDFGKLIWIDGALWRLNKITDFNVNEPDVTAVELLKVIEKIY